MKVLVTGGAGFVGSHVCDRLAQDGHELIILDDLSTGRVEQVHPGARFYQMDLESPWLDELFAIEQPDAVVHLAAQASVRRSVADPVFDARVNVLGTIALLQAASHHAVRRFLYASTGGAIYGDASVVPTPEDYPAVPVSPYGASKLAAELMMATFRAMSSLSYAALRYGNVYGPRQDPYGEAGVVAIFSRHLLAGTNAVITGDGKQTRDFVYVADVAEANALALNASAIGAFNVGNGTETSINEIFHILRDLTGSSQQERHGPLRPGEQRRSVLDATKIGRELGWRPNTSLREGLDRTVAYFKAEAAPRAPAAPR